MVAFTPAIAFTSSAHAAAWKVSPTKATVYVGKYKTLKSTKTAKWTSSKKSVAKLTASKGKTVKVKGVKAGTATISVKYKTTTKKIKITVKAVTKVTAVAVANYTTGDDTAVQVGDILKATVTPAGAAVTYQWMADGTAISGATEQTYKVAGTYAGQTITCKVTGTGAYSGSVTSTATAKVTKAAVSTVTIKYPTTAQNTSTNALYQVPYVGDTLTATAKTASGQVLSDVTYQWYYGSTAIKGATSASYAVTKDVLGQKLTCTVTGSTGVTGTQSAVTKAVSNEVAVSAVKSAVAVGGTMETAITPTQAAGDVTYQWAYKAKKADSYANLSGATSATYTAANAGYYQVTIALKSTSGYTLSSTKTAEFTVSKTALPAVTSKNVTAAAALTARTTNQVNDKIDIAVGTLASSNYSIAWKKVDADGTVTAATGAGTTEYTIGAGDVGYSVYAVVTGADDTDYAGATVESTKYAVTGKVSVAVSGTPTVGSTMTAAVTGDGTGTYAITSNDYTIQWYRVKTVSGTTTETAIKDATALKYVVTSDDMGYTLKAVVTGAKNYAGSTANDSASAATTTVVTALTLDHTTGTAGTAYTITPTTTPAGATGTYTVTTGTGISIVPSTGVVTVDTTAVAGTYTVTFTPSGDYSAAGGTVTASFVLN